jgi:hypothetical protein
MAFAVQTFDDVHYAWIEQATWGTIAAGSSSFASPSGMRLDMEAFDIDRAFAVRKANRSQAGIRHINATAVIKDYKRASPRFTLKGYIKLQDLPHFLYAVMQNVSEDAAAGVFSKTFTFPATQPDFTVGGMTGYIASVARKEADITKSVAVRDVIAEEVIVEWGEGVGDGIGMITVNCIARGAPTEDYDMTSSTVTRNPSDAVAGLPNVFYFEDLKALTIGGLDAEPQYIRLRIKNSAKPIGVDKGSPGQFRTYALGIQPDRYFSELTLRVYRTANMQSIRKDIGLSSGTTYGGAIASVLTWGTAAAAGHLGITMHGMTVKGDQADADPTTIEFVIEGMQNAANAPLTIVTADGVDHSW